MGKEHKKHKKHKHSKHKSKPKEEYYVPIVPLKSNIQPKTLTPIVSVSKDAKPIGPILPVSLSNSKSNESSIPDSESNDSYGPTLPPHLVPQKRVPGPSLPLDFKIEEKSEPIDDDCLGFGPLPAELIAEDSEQLFIQKQLELRANYMKRKFAGEVCLFYCIIKLLLNMVPIFQHYIMIFRYMSKVNTRQLEKNGC